MDRERVPRAAVDSPIHCRGGSRPPDGIRRSRRQGCGPDHPANPVVRDLCKCFGMTQHDRPEIRSLADLTPEDMTRISEGSFTDLIGLKYTEISLERVTAEWVVSPQQYQPAGIVNGGVYCTVIETLASVGGGVWYGDRGRVVGVNNNTDFLRAVREGVLRGVATPLHRGRLQQLWQVAISDEQDRVVARGQVRLQNLPATE